ncbi:histidine phosphatase family protein [Streptomyces sp. IBSBF 3136]|uniref:histidine phosphatase family protein n=1 Tax=Streptomyces sp. IBSBF 3136 TaxID=2903524 RepID=UPI002FDBAD1D
MTVRLTFLCVPGGGATTGPLLDDAPSSTHSLHMAAATKTTLLPSHELALRAPSARCTQAADALGLVTAPEPALCDLDLGSWSGLPLDDVAATDPDGFTAWLTDPDAAPHGGESVRELCRRTADWMNDTAPDTGHTVVIAEAAVVRAALIRALALPARAFWHLAVPPLSPVSLTRRNGSWDVRLGHLPGEPGQRVAFSRSATLVRPRRADWATGSHQVLPGHDRH